MKILKSICIALLAAITITCNAAIPNHQKPRKHNLPVPVKHIHKHHPKYVHHTLPTHWQYSSSSFPFWPYTTVIYRYPNSVVGPIKQMNIWIPGHYETKITRNGTSILVWIPDHYELRPAF